jgi:hypothetical protein
MSQEIFRKSRVAHARSLWMLRGRRRSGGRRYTVHDNEYHDRLSLAARLFDYALLNYITTGLVNTSAIAAQAVAAIEIH